MVEVASWPLVAAIALSCGLLFGCAAQPMHREMLTAFDSGPLADAIAAAKPGVPR